MKKAYHIYSLLLGLGAIFTLLYGILCGIFGLTFYVNEPILPVAILEILLGVSTLPYYFKKIFVFKSKEEGEKK
ncbi:MAG TPA: hypothetical protein VMV95_00175 [Bacillota bacterium]|nr:hypothetical protein [Bacillota bacterium]